MHEVGIAASILDAVQTETALHAPAHVVKVGVRIGPLAGIDPDSLAFSFAALLPASGLAPLELAVETGAADELEFCYLELESP